MIDIGIVGTLHGTYLHLPTSSVKNKHISKKILNNLKCL